MNELLEQHKRISDILNDVEHLQKNGTSRTELVDSIRMDILLDCSDCHVSKTTALKVGSKYPTHVHPDSVEIITCLYGTVVVTIADASLTLIEKQSIIVPRDTPHGGYALITNAQIISMCIPRDPNSIAFNKELESLAYGEQ